MLITKSCHQLMMSSKWELALKKRHKQDCMHQLIFGGAFKPTQYLGTVWLFPGLITTKKGRGKPRPLLALLCACEISWKLQTIYFSPAWHKPITCSMLFNTLCLSRGVAAWSSASHWDVQMNLVRVQLAHNWNKLMTVLATQERDAQRRISYSCSSPWHFRTTTNPCQHSISEIAAGEVQLMMFPQQMLISTWFESWAEMKTCGCGQTPHLDCPWCSLALKLGVSSTCLLWATYKQCAVQEPQPAWMVRLDDLKGPFQPNPFRDSTYHSRHDESIPVASSPSGATKLANRMYKIFCYILPQYVVHCQTSVEMMMPRFRMIRNNSEDGLMLLGNDIWL